MDMERHSLDSDVDTIRTEMEKKASSHRYDTLSDASNLTLLDELPKGQPVKSKSRKAYLAIACIFVIGCLSAITILSVKLLPTRDTLHHVSTSDPYQIAPLNPSSLYPPATGEEFGNCGHARTVSEARSLGCLFDPMSWLWVRPECYHAELLAEFMSTLDWRWYSNYTLAPEDEIPLSEIYAGDHPVAFTNKHYHKIHCQFMWQKMHNVLTHHLPIDTDLSNEHHTSHCGHVLLNEILHEDIQCTESMVCPTLVRATWTSCGLF